MSRFENFKYSWNVRFIAIELLKWDVYYHRSGLLAVDVLQHSQYSRYLNQPNKETKLSNLLSSLRSLMTLILTLGR